MADQQDRIRVWNEETSEMMEPATIQEMLCMERNVRLEGGWAECEKLVPEDYGHLVFVRNTGIYDFQSTVLGRGIEIFDGDLVTHSIEPYVYKVMQKHGGWWADALLPIVTMSRPLINIFHPTIVGNVFENRELIMKGEVIDE